MRRLALLLACLALAGCAGVSVEFGSAPTASPTPAESATVTDVVDGDTLDVRFPDGSEDTVRLVGVDTPEVHVETDPAEYPNIPDTSAGRECLRAAGHDATNFTADRVADRSVELAYDPNTDRRGSYDRLLAYVLVDDASLNYRLVATGNARVYESEFTRRGRYEDAMAGAREAGRGLWACAS